MIVSRLLRSVLTEVLNSPADWSYDGEFPPHQVDGVRYDNGRHTYSSQVGDKKINVFFKKNKEGSYEWIFNVDNDISVTGRGDQYQVFSTVINIVSDFIRKNNPKEIVFYAENKVPGQDNSRTRLYRRLMNRIAKQFDFEYEEKQGYKRKAFRLWRSE